MRLRHSAAEDPMASLTAHTGLRCSASRDPKGRPTAQPRCIAIPTSKLGSAHPTCWLRKAWALLFGQRERRCATEEQLHIHNK
ncbi:hypothetical protein GUJ93_ZPchr0004g39563 [Zizania palustris]|uniref:Uncharacterized protein n=1 Tax=Zizania palustris TaxID=103762 RepID=A0A8J5VNT8_ZIZPA|nr:hypothetical protein GUJ93_ZPchr0004g39563 [Zizania palustris]